MTTATKQASTELAVVPPAETALAVFSAPKGMDPWLQKIRAEIESFVPDVSTRKGRDSIASMAYKVAQAKNALDGVGKKVSADLKLIPKKVDAERKRVWDTLESWQEEVRRPLNEWQAREDARIDRHQAVIDELNERGAEAGTYDADYLRTSIARVEQFAINESLEEFEAEAARSKDKALTALRAALAVREKHDAELAAIAKFNAEQAERDAQVERDRIAREAAEKATREAEERARAEREAAAQRERDAQLAAERRELELKLQAEQAEREKLEAQQRADQAKRDADERAAAAEHARIAAEQQAAQDKIDAERRQAEAVERAAAAERQRQADEHARIEAEARAREADKAHKAKIMGEAKEALMSMNITEELARAIVLKIARREIPNVTISF